MRTLSLRELNRATLARQLLLERKKLTVVPAIERLAGLQAQWPAAPYVGLWSRLTDFKRESLERALLRGDVLKPTVMRGTLHLVTAREYPIYWWALRDMATWYQAHHLEHALLHVETVRGLAPITQTQLLAYLEDAGHADDTARRRIFYALRRRAHLLHTPRSALWKSRPQALFEAHDEPTELDVLEARRELVHRYLRAFGPATRADVAEWSGLRIADFADALEGLRQFEDEQGRTLYDVPRAPIPSADTPAPVRFLPRWDNTILAHADRSRVVPQELERAVQSGLAGTQTVLVDGMVMAEWTADKKGKVSVDPFAPLPRAAQRAVKEEAARLEAWLR